MAPYKKGTPVKAKPNSNMKIIQNSQAKEPREKAEKSKTSKNDQFLALVEKLKAREQEYTDPVKQDSNGAQNANEITNDASESEIDETIQPLGLVSRADM